MLREAKRVRQVEGDYFRRWFLDENFELYVWYKSDRTFFGFQLCYDLTEKAKALTWTEDGGYQHHAIDLGNDRPEANRTPIMTPHRDFDAAAVLESFRASDAALPAEIREFMREKLAASPAKT